MYFFFEGPGVKKLMTLIKFSNAIPECIILKALIHMHWFSMQILLFKQQQKINVQSSLHIKTISVQKNMILKYSDISIEKIYESLLTGLNGGHYDKKIEMS